MKKLILLILFLVMGATSCFGEPYPPGGGRDVAPIYWYLSDYAEQLKQALDKKHLFRFYLWRVEHVVKITRDGKIIPQYVSISDGKHCDNIALKIIMDNPPPPFDENIKEDYLIIGIYLIYDGWMDDVFVARTPTKISKEKIYYLYVKRAP